MTDYNKIFSVKTYKYYFWLEVNFARLLYKLLLGYKVEGRENVKDYKDSFLILSNHCSNVDPPLIAFSVLRPVAYMAKAELFKVPVLNKIIYWSGAYPVSRGSKDQSYIENTVKALQSGWVVNIYPEGERTEDGKFKRELKAGAAKILFASKVPFLPVALIDTHKAWGKGKKLKLFTKVGIKVGKLVFPEDYLPKEEMSEEDTIEYIKNVYTEKIYEILPEHHK